jgi:hypothetical protein
MRADRASAAALSAGRAAGRPAGADRRRESRWIAVVDLAAGVPVGGGSAHLRLAQRAHRDLLAEFAPQPQRDAVVEAVAAEIGSGDPATRALIGRLIELDRQAGDSPQANGAVEGGRHE